MNIECPKCKSTNILKRKSVPKIETHGKLNYEGYLREIKIAEPKFYTCYKCWYKFNIK